MFRCGFNISLGTRLSHSFKGTSMNSSAENKFQDHQVGIPSVFEVMRCVGGNIADIVGLEIHRAGIIDRKEYGHSNLAGKRSFSNPCVSSLNGSARMQEPPPSRDGWAAARHAGIESIRLPTVNSFLWRATSDAQEHSATTGYFQISMRSHYGLTDWIAAAGVDDLGAIEAVCPARVYGK